MDKLVTLTLTDSDCLNVRLALNATAMEWGDKASAHRAKGEDFDARICENIRSSYHRLWDAVNAAQEAAPDARLAWFDEDRQAPPPAAAPPATCCQFHMSGGERDLSCGGDFAIDRTGPNATR